VIKQNFRFYIAPELLKEWNSGGLLPSTDMYSLGMVVLRLLFHLDVGESEMLRINNRLRRAPTEEIITLFRCHLWYICAPQPIFRSIAT